MGVPEPIWTAIQLADIQGVRLRAQRGRRRDAASTGRGPGAPSRSVSADGGPAGVLARPQLRLHARRRRLVLVLGVRLRRHRPAPTRGRLQPPDRAPRDAAGGGRGRGNQRILPEVPRYTIPVADALPGDERAALDWFRADLSHRVVESTRWPLFDVRALRYGGGRIRVGFGFDYLMVDALSIMILLSELARLYRDPAARLPTVGVSFRDYVLSLAPGCEGTAASEALLAERVEGVAPGAPAPLGEGPVARGQSALRAA